MSRRRAAAAALALCGALASCAAAPPSSASDVCAIFEERRGWWRAAKASERRWGIPASVNMAFIYQESSFRSRVRPERRRFLWIFPGRRPSSAYGYAQALDSTWEEYERKSGNRRASRSDFGDAIDFVGWFNANSRRVSGIASANARDLYYAYHEGNGGYQRGTYLGKQWLIDAAGRVQANATRYEAQLNGCRADLDRGWLRRLLGRLPLL